LIREIRTAYPHLTNHENRGKEQTVEEVIGRQWLFIGLLETKAMTASSTAWWKSAIPAVAWLRGYQRSWFRLDFSAGITLAAYLLPAALGHASPCQLAARSWSLRLLVRQPCLLDFFAGRDTPLLRTTKPHTRKNITMKRILPVGLPRFTYALIVCALIVGTIGVAQR